MKVPYLPRTASTSLPSLGGSRMRHRPFLSARITGPAHFMIRDGLLDTGSDDTIFPQGIATAIGIDLTNAPQLTIHLAGRGPFPCRYAQAGLRITDGLTETYEWPAVIGFVPVPLLNPLFGHAGFLQFFDAEFRGADREVILKPNPSFPGQRI